MQLQHNNNDIDDDGSSNVIIKKKFLNSNCLPIISWPVHYTANLKNKIAIAFVWHEEK